MNTSSGGAECALISWGIAALVAVVAFAMLMLLGGWTFMQAAFVGAIVLVLGGIGMMWAFCRPLPGPNEVTLEKVTAPVASAAPAPAPAPAPSRPAVAETPAPAAVASAPEPSPAPAAAPAPEPAPEPAPVPEPAPAPAAVAEPVTEEAVAASKPSLLDAPEGAADDLKLIKGVGPKLEDKLNKMGVWHFSQIASWTATEIAWVDDTLNFKGRINRDDWIGQAKILAAGGTTEFADRTRKA